MYSGFGDENEHTGLEQILKEIEIKKLFVGGLVLEICVKETILDALKLGLIKLKSGLIGLYLYMIYFFFEIKITKKINLKRLDS